MKQYFSSLYLSFLQNDATSTKSASWSSNIVWRGQWREISVNLTVMFYNLKIFLIVTWITFMLGKWDLNLLIPCLVMSWQSYLTKESLACYLSIPLSTDSSILWRLWQPVRWSRLVSVIRGQLSSSSTIKFSLAQADRPRCLANTEDE